MSQIDKLIYIPLLFWFILLIIVLYFIIFSYFLTTFLTIFKTRIFFFTELKNYCKNELQKLLNMFKLWNSPFWKYNLYFNIWRWKK